VVGLFGAIVSGAFVLVGAIMAAAALVAGRGRRNGS
jgi:hypothetical protein